VPAVNINSNSRTPQRGVSQSRSAAVSVVDYETATVRRARIFYYVITAVFTVFIVRLFYLQIIKHDLYKAQAQQSQFKQYEIPATRGIIYARDGDELVPLVQNETLYTLVADPLFIKDSHSAAQSIAEIVGSDQEELQKQLETKKSRYVVLAKRLSKDQKDRIDVLSFAGIITRETSYRTYPQGNLAAQLVGFVNDDGVGQYGIEEYFDDILKGTPGQLRAITDARGIPLVSNKDNVDVQPVPGKDIVLSIDINMQRQTEEILKANIERSKSPSGSIVITDPATGQVRAMANYPTYDPTKLRDVTDLRLFSNPAVSEPLEVGSIMKTLTAATALDVGAVTNESSFFDPGYVEVDGKKIVNVGSSYGTQNVESTLVHSYNTGVTWMLRQMGGGSINQTARNTLYDYDTTHYYFGSITGIEQTGEAAGYVTTPDDTGAGINLTYANMTFGQAMTATPIQMAAALSSVINGGTYYRPTLVYGFRSDGLTIEEKSPDIRKSNSFKSSTGEQLRSLMEEVVAVNNAGAARDGYSVGGKTGTAEIAKADGGYYDDRYNGTYLGFVGGDQPEYVIAVKISTPQVPGNAGYVAAAPTFRDISNMILDNYGVSKTTR
jgi:stage V sporulation protein D (sporulation-specific penicillin-binding protein)